MMNCPICSIQFEEKQAHDLTTDVCPLCGSVWFDRGELELFERQVEREHLFKLDSSSEFKPKGDVVVECPKCGTNTLEMGRIRGYTSGRCSGCQGVWVNPGIDRRKPSEQLSSEGNGVWVKMTPGLLVALHLPAAAYLCCGVGEWSGWLDSSPVWTFLGSSLLILSPLGLVASVIALVWSIRRTYALGWRIASIALASFGALFAFRYGTFLLWL